MNTSKKQTEATLTQRENEILSLIARGLGSKQIADMLSISGHTVSNHRKNMLAKMGASSSAEMVYVYLNNARIGNSY